MKMNNWEYGGAYKEYPIPMDGLDFEDGSVVKV